MRPQYQLDYDELVSNLLPLMEQVLKDYPVLAPVGCQMDLEGKCSLVAAYPEEELPDTLELEELVLQGLRSQASEGKIKASALGYSCSIVTTDSNKQIPVLAIKLEHKHGEPETLYQPYEKTTDGVTFLEPFMVAGKPDIFDPIDASRE